MVWQLKKNTVKDFTEPKQQLWKNGQMFWEYIRNGKGIRNKIMNGRIIEPLVLLLPWSKPRTFT